MDGHWALGFGEAHRASSLRSCSPFTLYHPNFSSSALETSLRPDFLLLWLPHLPHTIYAGTCQLPQESPEPTDRTLSGWHPLLPMFTNEFGNYYHDWHWRPYSQSSKQPCQLWKWRTCKTWSQWLQLPSGSGNHISAKPSLIGYAILACLGFYPWAGA